MCSRAVNSHTTILYRSQVIIAGAFYPNYMKKQLKCEKDLIRDMDCRNHYTTVMVSVMQCLLRNRVIYFMYLFIYFAKERMPKLLSKIKIKNKIVNT